jgi:hypothetical protein
VRRSIVALTIAAVLSAPCAAPASAACHVRTGERIVLFGLGDDPGVFLWDSLFRLRAYHAASFDEAQALLPHAILLSAGTRAIVIRCYPDDVQPKYSLRPDDAVNVRVLTGTQRGRTGWIIGGDIQVLTTKR